MKPQFYTRIPILYSITLYIIFAVLCIGTGGICFFYLYDFFIHHKYWLNRRILYKYLNSENLEFTVEKFGSATICKFDNYEVSVYNKSLELTLESKNNFDLIGLFVSSSFEDRMVIKLIRKLNKLKPVENNI